MMISVSGLLGCATTPTSYDQVGQKQAQGSQIGTVVGSIVGGYIPTGGSVAGQVLQSQAGTIGNLVGGAIGAALDEEDRQALARATKAAFVSGQNKTFSNTRTGVRGSVTVTANSKSSSGQACRTLRQEAVLPNGKVVSEDVSACKGPNGWDV
jgi:surface antigen